MAAAKPRIFKRRGVWVARGGDGEWSEYMAAVTFVARLNALAAWRANA